MFSRMTPRFLPLLLFPTLVSAQPALEAVATGFDKPTWIGAVPGHPDHLLVMEQKGRTFLVDRTSGEKKPFADFSSRACMKDNEQGLLGLAFSPDYANDGTVFVNLTNQKGNTEILRVPGQKNGIPDVKAAQVLLSLDQPFTNHNGGWLDFGPDGFLYIATGDGGAADDPKNAAQDPKNLHGKMLRIDVNAEKGYTIPADNPFGNEVFMTGLRNPWRCSFDKKTGDLWIADVGQNVWEEINHVPAGTGNGLNFGWRLREAKQPNPNKKIAGPEPEKNHDPIYQYKHGGGEKEGISVTGGYLYRGPVQSLQSHYVFADYQFPHLWSFRPGDSEPTKFQVLNKVLSSAKPPVTLVTTFGVDSENNLYLADRGTGTIYKFVEK